jgi:hypothetical protein
MLVQELSYLGSSEIVAAHGIFNGFPKEESKVIINLFVGPAIKN